MSIETLDQIPELSESESEEFDVSDSDVSMTPTLLPQGLYCGNKNLIG